MEFVCRTDRKNDLLAGLLGVGLKTQKILEACGVGSTIADLARWPLVKAARAAADAKQDSTASPEVAAELAAQVGLRESIGMSELLALELETLPGVPAVAGGGLRLKTVADLAEWKFGRIASAVLELSALGDTLEKDGAGSRIGLGRRA